MSFASFPFPGFRTLPFRGLRTVALLAALTLAAPASAGAAGSGVIDFSGLTEGQVVDQVSFGSGISGDPVAGSVEVFGMSANPSITTNAAIIFDATCSGGCTGGDNDLHAPSLGNVLIIAEDLGDADHDGIIDDPDDADLDGAPFEFDFSGWGSGSVSVDSITVLDIEGDEGGATVELFAGGAPVGGPIPLPVTGDNEFETKVIGIAGVDRMLVTLNGSGAIDNIAISDPAICGDDLVNQAHEECDGSSTDLCAPTAPCLPDCTCGAPLEPPCGNGVLDPGEICDDDIADACVTRLCDSMCECVPEIFNDPAKIVFGRNGKLDKLHVVGRVNPPVPFADFESDVTFRLTNDSGETLYEGTLPGGTCASWRKGTACRYLDRDAKKGNAAFDEIARFYIRPHRPAGYYLFLVNVYLEMPEITDPIMTFEIAVGEQRWASRGVWKEKRNGWRYHFAAP